MLHYMTPVTITITVTTCRYAIVFDDLENVSNVHV